MVFSIINKVVTTHNFETRLFEGGLSSFVIQDFIKGVFLCF
jgi:hypothetical protein